MFKFLMASAALVALSAGPASAQTTGATCQMVQVGSQGLCSVGPIDFTGNCEAGPYSNERDVAIELGSPEASPVFVSAAATSVVVYGDNMPPQIFIGDSDDPDPVTPKEFLTTVVNGDFYGKAEWRGPAGFGKLWQGGPTVLPQGSQWRSDLTHHIDVHITCSPGAQYAGNLWVEYYAVPEVTQ